MAGSGGFKCGEHEPNPKTDNPKPAKKKEEKTSTIGSDGYTVSDGNATSDVGTVNTHDSSIPKPDKDTAPGVWGVKKPKLVKPDPNNKDAEPWLYDPNPLSPSASPEQRAKGLLLGKGATSFGMDIEAKEILEKRKSRNSGLGRKKDLLPGTGDLVTMDAATHNDLKFQLPKYFTQGNSLLEQSKPLPGTGVKRGDILKRTDLLNPISSKVKNKKPIKDFLTNGDIKFKPPKYFAQMDLKTMKTAKGNRLFSDYFASHSCNTVSNLNEVSEEYTKITGKQMTDKQAGAIIKKATETTFINWEGKTKHYIEPKTSYINDQAGFLNLASKELGIDKYGKWTVIVKEGFHPNAGEHLLFRSKILGPKNEKGVRPLIGTHFVNNLLDGSNIMEVFSGTFENLKDRQFTLSVYNTKTKEFEMTAISETRVLTFGN